MKKVLLFGLAGLLVLTTAGVAFPANAQPPVINPGATPTQVSVEDAIYKIFNIAFWLLLAVAAIFFLLGAYYFLTAGTSPDAATKGKSIISYAIVAIIIAILSKGIAAFLPRMFGI